VGRFADGGVLVVGPSTVFTNYISRVLPALGEESVHLRAIGELVDGVSATRRDAAVVAEVKGSERMREVLIELMWQTPPGRPDRLRWCTPVRCSRSRRPTWRRHAIAFAPEADTQGVAPNAAREVAATVLLDTLWVKVDGPHLQRDLFAEDVGDRREFLRFLQAWWPRLTPPKVLSVAEGSGTCADPGCPKRHRRWRRRISGTLTGPSTMCRCSTSWASCSARQPPSRRRTRRTKAGKSRELTSGTQIVENFVLSCGLHDGWSLYAPGLPTPIALAGPAIDNDAIARRASAGREAVILREGHRVVGWTDGFDPHGEEGYVPVLAEPLPVASPRTSRRTPTIRARDPRRGTGSVADGVPDDRAPRRVCLDDDRGRPRSGNPSAVQRLVAAIARAAWPA
jgi:hypothetical protein